MNRFALMGALALTLSAPAIAQEAPSLDYRLPPTGIAGLPDGPEEFHQKLTNLYYIAQLGAWCARFGHWTNGAWGGCLAEYQIPPKQLRALRASAGLPLETPVWNPTKGELVPLPSDQ